MPSCHFDYASIIWSNTFSTYTDPLVALQGRAGRVILGAPKLTPTDQVLGMLHWTPMKTRWQCQRGIMMFKVAKGLAPRYLTESFTPLTESYSNTGRVTRGSTNGNFHTPSSGNDWGKRRFASHGANLWNNLPTSVKNIHELPSFKCAIKSLGKHNYPFYSPL